MKKITAVFQSLAIILMVATTTFLSAEPVHAEEQPLPGPGTIVVSTPEGDVQAVHTTNEMYSPDGTVVVTFMYTEVKMTNVTGQYAQISCTCRVNEVSAMDCFAKCWEILGGELDPAWDEQFLMSLWDDMEDIHQLTAARYETYLEAARNDYAANQGAAEEWFDSQQQATREWFDSQQRATNDEFDAAEARANAEILDAEAHAQHLMKVEEARANAVMAEAEHTAKELMKAEKLKAKLLMEEQKLRATNVQRILKRIRAGQGQ